MKKLTLRKIYHRLLPKGSPDPWPHVGEAAQVETPFLVLLTPPNSGSSAIGTFLGQDPGIAGLGWPEFGAGRVYEGQWLVPGLSAVDRWWPEKYINWSSVIATWSRRIEEKKRVEPVDFILEKSPPNIVRYKALKAALCDARFIISNREPFANVASQIKRYESNIYLGVPRSEAITHLAEQWVYRSRLLLEAQREEHFEMISYEEFCTNPQMIVEAFGLSGQLELRRDYRVQVKDYAKTEITNMNERQVSDLTADEIGLIRNTLARSPDLVRQFGYRLYV